MADIPTPLGAYQDRRATPNELLPGLRRWQIFFLLASVVIGEGIFSGDREALEVAGPAGTLIALVLVGVLAIAVMGSVSELVQLFPVPNAIVRYIEAFVDEDLAWCCGLAYWYTWTAIFVDLYYIAVNLTAYWHIPNFWHNCLFVVSPIVLFGFNLLSVDLFGIVEFVGGIVKVALVIGVGIAMYCLHFLQPLSKGPTPLYDGIEANPGIVAQGSKAAAILYVIPSMSYSFLGVESITVMIFEACDVQSLRMPSRLIAIFILIIYGFCLVGELLVYSWLDKNNPEIFQSPNNPPDANSGKMVMAVVAAENAGHPHLATLINIGCMYSALSASNSALYIASRTLYGLARESRESETQLSNLISGLGRTTKNTRVPILALFVSMTTLFWVPFISNKSDSLQLLFDILLDTSSAMCLIVWAALCGASLRFRHWYELCRKNLDPGYEKFDYKADTVDGANTYLMFLEPWLAWGGCLGSLTVVIALSGAPLWMGPTAQKFAISYTAHLLIIVLWGGRKLWRTVIQRRDGWGWVKIDSDANPLMHTMTVLSIGIPERSYHGWREFVDQHPWSQGLERCFCRIKRRHSPTAGDLGTETGTARTGSTLNGAGQSIPLQTIPQTDRSRSDAFINGNATFHGRYNSLHEGHHIVLGSHNHSRSGYSRSTLEDDENNVISPTSPFPRRG